MLWFCIPSYHATSAAYLSIIGGVQLASLRQRCNRSKSQHTPTKKSTFIAQSCVDAALCCAVKGRTQPQCLPKCQPVKKGVCCVFTLSHENQDRWLRARYFWLWRHEVVSALPRHRLIASINRISFCLLRMRERVLYFWGITTKRCYRLCGCSFLSEAVRS
jgi:hypothetical protein